MDARHLARGHPGGVRHLGGGAQWTLSSYGLQRIVPDRIRGRVFAFDFGLVTASIAVAAALAGFAADHVDVRAVMVGFAALGMGYSVLWTVLTRKVGGPWGRAALGRRRVGVHRGFGGGAGAAGGGRGRCRRVQPSFHHPHQRS